MITTETTYTIKCDFCYGVLAAGSELSAVVDEATDRCIVRSDGRWGRKVFECYNCKAKREVRKTILNAVPDDDLAKQIERAQTDLLKREGY